MQRISNRMGYTIGHMYSQSGIISTFYGGGSSNINYENNNAFPMFFKVGACGDRIELPIFGKETVQNKILFSLQTGHRSDVVMPFVRYTDDNLIFRSADTLIRYLTETPSYRKNMYHLAKTNKDEVYYGANGLLFDKDMNLLFMSLIECDIEGTVIRYNKVKVFIHPLVFYSDGIVEKCLINKVIPYSLREGVTVYGGFCSANVRNLVNFSGPNDYRTQHKAVPEIVVADVKDKFFYKPVLHSSTFSNEDVNEVLKRNLDDIFNIMSV